MKKIILFMLLVLSIGINAQKYVPFPTENAAWNVRYISIWNTPPIDTTLLKYSLQGDTVINNIQYKKICRNIGTYEQPKYIWVGGLREQDKKIYYLGGNYNAFVSGQFYGQENLLYDFTKKVGDTVRINFYSYYKILSIDSVKIGSEYRKRYKITGGYMHNPDYIIEGIGSVLEGLLGRITEIPTCGDCYQDWEFVCFSQNDESVYKNPAYVDCNSTQKWSEKKYLADDACWTYFEGVYRYQTYLNGDTILNGKTYKKVFNRLSDIEGFRSFPNNIVQGYVGAIRESSGKVFANIDNQNQQFGEFLLYDFTVNKGDTIHRALNNGSELSVTRVVYQIDTIVLLNGEKRKKIFNNYTNPWFEGMGSPDGLLWPAYPLTTSMDGPPILMCFKQNGTELYKNTQYCPNGDCCDLLAGVPETKADLKRSILLPNPTRDVAMLEFTNTETPCNSVEIADVLGKRVKTITVTNSSEYKLDLTDYAAGIYYVLVKYKDRTESHKIIKM